MGIPSRPNNQNRNPNYDPEIAKALTEQAREEKVFDEISLPDAETLASTPESNRPVFEAPKSAFTIMPEDDELNSTPTPKTSSAPLRDANKNAIVIEDLGQEESERKMSPKELDNSRTNGGIPVRAKETKQSRAEAVRRKSLGSLVAPVGEGDSFDSLRDSLESNSPKDEGRVIGKPKKKKRFFWSKKN